MNNEFNENIADSVYKDNKQLEAFDNQEVSTNAEIEEVVKSEEVKSLRNVSRVFRDRMNLIRQTINRVYPELKQDYEKDIKIMEKAISKFAEEDVQDEIDYTELLHILKTTNIPFVSIFIKGMFLNIFSELDTFTGNFLYNLLSLKPDVINGNQKQFNASEVFECENIDDFRGKVIQKEIDNIRRDSYIDQISIFEKLFNIETLKKFSNWSKYVEVTQRRNIIMHCDGIVTEQYSKICDKNNCKPYTKVGEKLDVDYEYLINAISIIEEVSIKLVQVLWRKCFSEKKYLIQFDEVLNEYIYALLVNEEWNVAAELGDFAYNTIKSSTGEYRMFFLINYCIALNNLNKKDKTTKLLNKVDFSATHREFLLAKYVLIDDINNAIKIMNEIGDKGQYFNIESYATFPLFNEIRQNEDFKLNYNRIFGEDINKNEIKIRIKETEEEYFNVDKLI